MHQFEYHEPATLAEALEMVERHGEEAHLLAGGTALVLLMRAGLILPDHVIALRRITELRSIGILADGGLEIGALATHRELERSAMVQRFFAPLAQTFSRVATVRIRNQATVGGNLVHADPASDPPAMLLALDAEVVLKRRQATRTVALDGFFRDLFQTALEPGEILTSIRIPPPAPTTRATYLKFLPGSKDDFATVAIAALVRLDEAGICRHARFGLGALGLTPLRAPHAEASLVGKALSERTIGEAAAIVAESVAPLDDARGSAAYKRTMTRVLVTRALRELAAA
jgi:carbon-monoxide dehydrogenase medium subunit